MPRLTSYVKEEICLPMGDTQNIAPGGRFFKICRSEFSFVVTFLNKNRLLTRQISTLCLPSHAQIFPKQDFSAF